MDNPNKSLITDEERTRHEALFFSQDPIEGLLPGEKARELFLLSKLPLQILSQVWQLVDIPHDNMLDSSEFTSALYLLQQSLLGRPVPPQLPSVLSGESRADIRIPVMSRQEYGAYKQLFMSSRRDAYGFVQAETARDIMLCSGLPLDVLAHIWNLSDQDRDAKLNLEQFTIACHLIRFCKKGGKLDHPVNVQAMLPHKLPKTDLVAKRKRLSLLEKRKQQLMAQRERCRSQATREGKRVELWKQRLAVLSAMHNALRQNPTSELGNVLTQEKLQEEREALNRMRAVAERLKSEDDSIRRETSRVIIQEQKLSKDLRALEEEAEQLRKRRQRNSVIKDLDPFHQLYEDRKEEKLTGVAKEKPDWNIQIPKGLDPFDLEKIKHPPLSGQELFHCAFNNNTDEHAPTGFINNNNKQLTPHTNNSSPWSSTSCQDVDPKLMALAQGFEDSFVEQWKEEVTGSSGGGQGMGDAVNSQGLKELEKNFNFEDHQDTVFRTVPVTAEEDDLWRDLPVSEGVSPGQEFSMLQSQLYTIKEQIKGLEGEGPQVVFKDPETYRKSQEKPVDSGDQVSHVIEDILRDRRRYRSVEPGTDVTGKPRNLHIAERKKKKADQSNSSHPSQSKNSVEEQVHYQDLRVNQGGADTDRQLAQGSRKSVLGDELQQLRSQDTDVLKQSQQVEFHSQAQGNEAFRTVETGVSPFQHLEINTDEGFDLVSNKNIQYQDALLQIQFDKPDICRDIDDKTTRITEKTAIHHSVGQSAHTLEDLTDVQQRGASSLSRSERLKKSQTWCVSENLPIPPPRKKSSRKSHLPGSGEGETSEKVKFPESQSSTRSAAIDLPSSPQRPPRKTSPQKKRSVDTGNSSEASHSSCGSTPQCSTSSSPVRNLSEKPEVSNLEGTASSESSPVPPPRIRKASKKLKGSPGHSHNIRSASSDEVITSPSTVNTEIGDSNSNIYQNVERSEKSNFTKEIEALFDEVTEGTVKESQKSSNLTETASNGTSEGNLILQGKSNTSDYFSQSDGSLIEDDMDAAARKLELEKLRNQYFGHKSKSKEEKTAEDSEVSVSQQVSASSTEINSTLITLDDYKTVNPASVNEFTVEPAVRRQKVDDRQLKSSDSDDSPSKRDSGFLDDAFSSVSFESEPSLQPVSAQPVKVSLDLDKYQREFGSTLSSNKTELPADISSQDTEKSDQKLTFVETNETPLQQGNSVLINFEEADTQETDKDSDLTENGGTFKADFDPFAMTDMNQQVSKAVNNNNGYDADNNNVHLMSHQSSSEISGTFNILNTNNTNNIGDNEQKYNDSLIAGFSQEDTSDVNRNSLCEEFSFLDTDVNESADSEAPPLPLQPPPPLPTNPPPPVASLRSALRQDNNLLDFQGEQPSRNVSDITAYSEDYSNNNTSLTNKAEQVPYGSVPEEFKDVVKEPTSDNPGEGDLKQVNLVHQSFPKEEFRPDNNGEKDITGLIYTSGDSEGLVNTVTQREELNRVAKVKSVDEHELVKQVTEGKEQQTNPSDFVSQKEEAASMDPVTGLRRTNVSDPVGKALKFVHDTEMSFRVKKVNKSPEILDDDDGSYLTGLKTRSQEIQEERQEILESMKIKKRSFHNWSTDSQIPEDLTGAGGVGGGSMEKSESEKRYEERKRKQEAARVENGYLSNSGGVSPQSPQSPGSAYPLYRAGSPYQSLDQSYPSQNDLLNTGRMEHLSQADIDSRSLTENKEKTKQQWEEHFSSPNAQLFPQHVKSTESVRAQKPTQETPKPKLNEYESAIEREIRLAQQREEELRREKEKRLKEQSKSSPEVETIVVSQEVAGSQKVASPRMSVTKVTTVKTERSTKIPGDLKGTKRTNKTLSPQSYREMTEVDRDSVSKQESIIERDIREQREREEEVKRQAEVSLRKETRQSEQVQKDKVKKENSITDRDDILQQRKREQEAERLRALARGEHVPASSVIHVQTVQKVQTVQHSASAPEPAKTRTITTQNTQRAGMADTLPQEYSPHTSQVNTKSAYRDAIPREGESIIERELREQREREEELRQQCQSLGMEVPKTQAPDTPFNMPEPRQPPPIKGSTVTRLSTTSTIMGQREQMNSSNTKYMNIGANKLPRRASSDSASSRSTEYGGVDPATQMPQGKTKVQPYTGDDSDEEETFRFIPQNETPVEREIRLSRERDEQLRREKGLPALNYDSQDSGSDVMYEIPTTEVSRPPTYHNYRRGQSAEGQNVMKQFASSRLMSEIEKDKQRELDLKSSGNIHTLSEERTTMGARYVDIIPKDPGPPPMPKTTPGAPKSKSMEFTMTADPVRNGSSMQKAVIRQEVSSQEAPVVTRTTSAERSEETKGPQSGEGIIARELREMKEREEELRQQRVMVSSHIGPTGVVIEVEPRPKPRQNGNADIELKTSRRKSALAEEWERKFGATN